MRVKTQRGETFSGYHDLWVTSCHECGVLYAMPERMRLARIEDGGTFYCPNGHGEVFCETNAQRLEKAQREAQRAEDRAARFAAERDQALAAERGQRAAKTRIKNQRDRERARVGRGVCPCCNRTFQNVQRHMASQHPEHHRDHSDV